MSSRPASIGKRKATVAALSHIAAMTRMLTTDSDEDCFIVESSKDEEACAIAPRKLAKHVHGSSKRPMLPTVEPSGLGAKDGDDDKFAASLCANADTTDPSSRKTDAANTLVAPIIQNIQENIGAGKAAVVSILAAADALRTHADFFATLDTSVAPLVAENKRLTDELTTLRQSAATSVTELATAQAKVLKADKTHKADLTAANKARETIADLTMQLAAKDAEILKLSTPITLTAAMIPAKTVQEHKMALMTALTKQLVARRDDAKNAYKEVRRNYNAECATARTTHASEMANYTASMAAPQTGAQPVPVTAYEFYDARWINISNPTIVSELNKLVGAPLGSKVTYQHQSNTYEAELVDPATASSAATSAAAGSSWTVAAAQLITRANAAPSLLPPFLVEQTNSSHSAHTKRLVVGYQHVPPAAAPAQPTLKLPNAPPDENVYVSRKTLYGEPFKLDMTLIRAIHDDLDANINDASVHKGGVGSLVMAQLANLWSETASAYSYSASACKMWDNPAYLKAWCHLALKRNLDSVRIMMHGSQAPDELLSDPLCYDINRAGRNGSARGAALYLSHSDHIPTKYNKGSGYLDGTGVFGLLLCNITTDRVGSMAAYKLSHDSTPEDIKRDRTILDAIALYDQQRWLPLGLAVAR